MAHENVIEMREITKIFGEFVANDKINLELRKGEIHALLGENGAGKSTLMNMLAGLLEPTSGEIVVNGKSEKLDSPSKAASLGIGMVHQHFMLVEAFTVAENIILGSEVTNKGVLDLKKANADILELSERYGLAVDPTAKVADISVGAQQRVEILKTLYRGADILIFDEPTAVLTPAEILELMDIMKALVKEGKSIILITHKLDEIRAVADRVTVIRRGKSIQTVSIEGATNKDLAEMMVGRSVSFVTEKEEAQPKEVVLQISDLVVNENRGVPAVKELSIDVRAGEIVGIAGIDGNGQSELIQAITGLRKVKSGSIKIKGQDFSIKGGNITGNDVNINVANLHLESLQDKEKSRHNGFNVSAGSSSVGAGVEYGNHDKSWVNEQSSIIGKNSANITVGEKTNLIGSVIGGGNTTLRTGELEYSDIHDKDKGYNFGINGNVSFSKNDKDEWNISKSIGANYGVTDREQINRATIGAGTVIVGGKTVNPNINRDENKTQIVTKDINVGTVGVEYKENRRKWSDVSDIMGEYGKSLGSDLDKMTDGKYDLENKLGQGFYNSYTKFKT